MSDVKTDDDKFKEFLKGQTPLCLGLPIYGELVRRNLYFLLSERSEKDFNGRNLFDKQCANVNICDTECRGRPIPKYPELESIIAKYNVTEGEWGGHPVWFMKVETCKTCPFKSTCVKLCPSVDAFHYRKRNNYDYNLDRAVSLSEVTEEWLEQLYMQEEEGEWVNRMDLSNDDIAWDCLTEAQEAAVMMVLVQGKSFEQAAEVRGVYANAVYKAFNSGMSKLREYGMARRALKNDTSNPYARDHYLHNMAQSEIANKYQVSTYKVSTSINSFKIKHNINS